MARPVGRRTWAWPTRRAAHLRRSVLHVQLDLQVVLRVLQDDVSKNIPLRGLREPELRPLLFLRFLPRRHCELRRPCVRALIGQPAGRSLRRRVKSLVEGQSAGIPQLVETHNEGPHFSLRWGMYAPASTGRSTNPIPFLTSRPEHVRRRLRPRDRRPMTTLRRAEPPKSLLLPPRERRRRPLRAEVLATGSPHAGTELGVRAVCAIFRTQTHRPGRSGEEVTMAATAL